MAGLDVKHPLATRLDQLRAARIAIR